MIGKEQKNTKKITVEIEESVWEEWEDTFGWVPNKAALFTAAISRFVDDINANKVKVELDLKN